MDGFLKVLNMQNAADISAIKSNIMQQRQVTTKCTSYFRGLSDGVVYNVTYRVKHVVKAIAYDIQLLYGNFYHSPSDAPFDMAGPNEITIKASIELSSGTIYPLTFNGADSVTIKPGGTIATDPISLYLSVDDVIYTRTYVSVTSGQKFPTGQTTLASDGEGETSGDITVSGAYTSNAKFAYAPFAIIGKTKSNSKGVYIFGDSISVGTGDSPTAIGYIAKGVMNTLPYSTMGLPSDVAYNAVNPYIYRKLTTKYCTHAIVEYGINDLSKGQSLSQIQNNLIKIWTELKNRGLKVYQCTITPKTTSTDSWATVANQTSFGQESVRVQLNNWIRTTPSVLDGYFEIADLAESARNSGKWKAGYTTDGTHPNQTGHVTLAAGIDIAKL